MSSYFLVFLFLIFKFYPLLIYTIKEKENKYNTIRIISNIKHEEMGQ